ncbi:hypothetical protein LCGC14_1992030 [marine sediment metagenome]|uniref:Uncharacterized protein n=1 Tax=marine sediment metagenome TaxID=412755 RepID=A0A0F9HJ59_9ZZZZ
MKCSKGFSVKAEQIRQHCNLSSSWVYKEYLDMVNPGITFLITNDVAVHVGYYYGCQNDQNDEWIYHYGNSSDRVIKNLASQWIDPNYPLPGTHYSFYERQ